MSENLLVKGLRVDTARHTVARAHRAFHRLRLAELGAPLEYACEMRAGSREGRSPWWQEKTGRSRARSGLRLGGTHLLGAAHQPPRCHEDGRHARTPQPARSLVTAQEEDCAATDYA